MHRREPTEPEGQHQSWPCPHLLSTQEVLVGFLEGKFAFRLGPDVFLLIEDPDAEPPTYALARGGEVVLRGHRDEGAAWKLIETATSVHRVDRFHTAAQAGPADA